MAVLTTEIAHEMGRERAPTAGSISLEAQYEQLDACCHAGAVEPCNSAVVRRSSTVSMFVDLVENECSPICRLEADDSTADCSDTPCLDDVQEDGYCAGSKVSVHVEIDEDDDDVYFSVHRQDADAEQAEANGCVKTVQNDVHLSGIKRESRVSTVHVDIDEEDDDIFFSVHNEVEQRQAEPADICQQSVLSEAAPLLTPDSEELICNSAEPDLDPSPEGALDNDSVCQVAEASLTSTDSSNAHALQGSKSTPVPERPVARRSSGPSVISDEDAVRRGASTESVNLRPVVCNSSDQAPTSTGSMAPGLLAHLKGGRAQGVRNYLARKLTQETEEP